jgi:hypothetical protein
LVKQLPWGLFGLNKGKENSAYFRTGIKAPIPLAGDRRYTSFLDNLSFQAALGLERGLNRYEIEGFKRYQPNIPAANAGIARQANNPNWWFI